MWWFYCPLSPLYPEDHLLIRVGGYSTAGKSKRFSEETRPLSSDERDEMFPSSGGMREGKQFSQKAGHTCHGINFLSSQSSAVTTWIYHEINSPN